MSNKRKWILLDADDGHYLDIMFEARAWHGVVHTHEYDNTTVLWIKRTPEEKGEKPYTCRNCGKDLPHDTCIYLKTDEGEYKHVEGKSGRHVIIDEGNDYHSPNDGVSSNG